MQKPVVTFKTEKEFRRFMKKKGRALENPPMRCLKHMRLSMLIPINCYNCMNRKGYPQYLGGDEGCENFELAGRA